MVSTDLESVGVCTCVCERIYPKKYIMVYRIPISQLEIQEVLTLPTLPPAAPHTSRPLKNLKEDWRMSATSTWETSFSLLYKEAVYLGTTFQSLKSCSLHSHQIIFSNHSPKHITETSKFQRNVWDFPYLTI